ncbi:MAG: alpha/beta hydrolase [Chitinophagaceae bacterium]|nr:MAG: alpha/beta hydrolase [Chitinophagaceae bacterium]
MNLPKGNYEFKITRGSWEKAESKIDGKAVANRTINLTVDTTMEIEIANWTDNFTQVKEEYHFGDHVHIVDSAFFMPQMNKYRQVWIYLPKDYSKLKKKYPVIYMQDGQNLFHANPPRANEWAVDSVMDSLIREGSKEMIIVGIDHGGKDRLKEYNPYDSQYGKGEGKAYIQFLVETLKPYIDSKYRTLKDAKHTSIAGSSMGGLISMYAITEYPKVYGSAGVFSPAFWLAPKIYSDVTDRLSHLKNSKVFFVAGDKEGTAMVRDMKKLYDILNPDGTNKNVVLSEKEDGKHTEWFWHREFVPFYKFIAQ